MSATTPETLLEQLFYVTVRLEAQLHGGGTSIGTGFIYKVPVGPDQEVMFIVTNKHVVADAEALTVYFIKQNQDGGPALGSSHRVTISPFSTASFYGHPDDGVDVAVMFLAPMVNVSSDQGIELFFRSIGSNSVPTLAQLDELDAIEDVRFVGYPDGIYDTQNFLPVVRKGTTASYLQHDYEGKPTFLIDASVFPGSSGSPVFIADNGSFTTKDGLFLGSRVWLLGIVAAVRQTERTGHLVIAPTSTVAPVVSEMLDLGIVYKARTIDECVDVLLARNGLVRIDPSAADEPTAAEASASVPSDQQAPDNE